MSKKKQLIVSWSGGKDSTAALYHILQHGEYEIISLITTITDVYNRISIHGVRKELLIKQADSLGIDLKEIYIPKHSTNKQYESGLKSTLLYFRQNGINEVLFGDIFLEDVKKYRDKFLDRLSMHGNYPLWLRDSNVLADDFIRSGFKAVTTCVDSTQLGIEFAGREYNSEFLSNLPSRCDPCGEYGEFHTFVYDGPIFQNKIEFDVGNTIMRDSRFYYTDLKCR